MASKVFINYRRAESLKDARHLATLLDAGALKGHIFIDLKGLDGSDDWLIELERQVAASDVVLSLICPNWTDIRDPTGRRRIDDDNDFVRFELAEAFRRKIPVIPVLVDGAHMPRGSELPPNLLLLTRPQAELLRSETFEADVAKIGVRVRAELAERRKQRRHRVPVWGAAAMAVVGLAAGLAIGPIAIEKLGLAAPLAAERIRSLEASYAETANTLAQARAEQAKTATDLQTTQAGLQKTQSELAQTLRDRDAARGQVTQLGDELTKTRAELTNAKQSASATSSRLNKAIDKYAPRCPAGSPFREIQDDGTATCASFP